MYLSELKLWNFRKYGKIGSSSDKDFIKEAHLIVPFHKHLNVLIGINDSGKTAIIDAIKLALKTHAFEWIKVEDDDFFNNETKLRIELEFRGLKPNEAKNFIEWLGWEGDGDNAVPVLRLIYHVERNDDRILPSEVKAGMDDVGFPLNAEARDYLKSTYLKALRDAESDLTAKKNSRLSQILQGHKLFKKQGTNADHPFEEKFKALNKELENWFKDDSENEGTSNKKEIKGKIDAFLEDFIDKGIQSNFTLGNSEIKTILEKISLGIENGKKLGLGTMNRLYMAAELLHLNKKWNGVKMCLIEEMEAHLHPQAQMKIIESLKNQIDVQFILSTHSPNLASKLDLHNLILCNDDDVFPLGDSSTIEDKNFNTTIDKYTKLTKENYIYLKRFLDVTKSNLFFAKGVILVEGWSEEILIPTIAKTIGIDLTQKEISIINVGSTAYLHFAKIFLRNDEKELNIPVSVVIDLDIKPDEKGNFEVENEIKKRESIENDFTDFSGTKIMLGIAKQWTLEWCLYKSPLLSKLLKKAVSIAHSGTAQFQLDESGNFKPEFEGKFIEKLSKKDGTSPLDKVRIASELAGLIENEKPDLSKDDEYIKYLIDAIKHACCEV